MDKPREKSQRPRGEATEHGRPSESTARIPQEAYAQNKRDVVQNKRDGIRREEQVQKELEEQYPNASVQRELYLRNKDGTIAKDPLTKTARRIDHVVIEKGKVIDCVETTAPNVDKTAQQGKERRIREAGGYFVKDRTNEKLVSLRDVQTRVVRVESKDPQKQEKTMAKAMDNSGESKPDKKNVPDRPSQQPQTSPTAGKLREQATNLQNQRSSQRVQAPNTADKHLPRVEFRQRPMSPEAQKVVKEQGPINRDMKPKVVAEGSQPTKPGRQQIAFKPNPQSKTPSPQPQATTAGTSRPPNAPPKGNMESRQSREYRANAAQVQQARGNLPNKEYKAQIRAMTQQGQVPARDLSRQSQPRQQQK